MNYTQSFKQILSHVICLIPLLFTSELSGEETQKAHSETNVAAEEPSPKLIDRIGQNVVDLIQQATRVEAMHAGKFDYESRGKEGTVAMRVIEGDSVKVSDSFVAELKTILLSESTYFNQDSKGTKKGIGLKLWSKDGSCLEVSYCVIKGNMNFVAKDKSGTMIKIRKNAPGGFRNDKNHPIRPLTAKLFPQDEDLQHYLKDSSASSKNKTQSQSSIRAKTATEKINTRVDSQKRTDPTKQAVSDKQSSQNPLIAEDAKLEKVVDGFTFAEGPASAPNGDLYFVDFRVNKIFRWDVRVKKLVTITEDSFATNGMQFDSQGRLIGCQGGKRRIVAFKPETAEVVEVMADKFEGKIFNNPNDLWIDPRGGIYFTDPAYSRKKEELELDGKYVFYISPTEKQVIKVATDYHTPNGIVGTKDGKQLYITDRRLGRTWSYSIQEDGTLADKKLFCKVGADGITLDEKGNLYTTPNSKMLRVFDSTGKELPSIPLPTPASNVCFAGEDGKTLFITTAKALYSLQMKVTGQ